MYCSSCGKPIQTGSAFCSSCGTKVSTTSDHSAQAEKRSPRLKSDSWARQSGVRQCWSITLVVKGMIFTALFGWLIGQFTCDQSNQYTTEACVVFNIDFLSGYVHFLNGILIFATAVGAAQVLLGLFVSVQDCCPPQQSLALHLSGYIGWVILTLCELPAFIVVWTISVGCWTVPLQGWAYVVTGLAAAAASFSLFMTSILAHSFRPKYKSEKTGLLN
jgi:hypothetical protein